MPQVSNVSVEVPLSPTVLVEVTGPDAVSVGVVFSSPSGSPGNSGFTAVVGDNALSGGMLVTTDDDGELIQADPTNPDHAGRAIGMLAGAVTPGLPAFVTTVGEIEQPWNWTPGEQLYLGASGQPVPYASLPPGSVFALWVGSAISATKIDINVSSIAVTLAG